jgi:hypothetical protein
MILPQPLIYQTSFLPQNKRGGRVQLRSIAMPEMEFNHAEKGDALFGMELALSLEKVGGAIVC